MADRPSPRTFIGIIILENMNIEYRLESIAETEFRMNYDFDYSKFAPEKLQVQIGHEIKPSMETDQIVVKAKATLVYAEGEIELATNSIMMRFGLSPIKDIIIIKDDGTFSAQDALVIDTFLVAAIGALRGIMMKNLKGTPLEPYYIPLIPIENFRTKRKK
ncbi:MAG: hypothetical protein IAC07_00805 [Bacteroidetes bacterium]|uniref:Preprotein translocase subunit SecB n=1 Tax=Candidatus Cryptobacteroides gallistercoris TaxID=2840765 RepID=A0A940IF43_9BACT|nr:hypothetical protein [Candidatus Cryptobacteroides gallistercoris]